MGKECLLPILIFLMFFFFLLYFHSTVATGTIDGSEEWGYVEVRKGAHLLRWHYKSPYRINDTLKPWPIILWHEGGPVGSAIGFGNFLKIGPVTAEQKPRYSTWLRKADLLFVDSSVGTGFSYVEDDRLAVKTDEDAAADLVFLSKELFNQNKELQKCPLYIFGESYGGKIAVTLGLAALEEIRNGTLNLQLGGIALGNSWISPEDFVISWGPLLKDLSRLDNNGLKESTRLDRYPLNLLARKIKEQLADGKYRDAMLTWEKLNFVIYRRSNHVVHNFSYILAQEWPRQGCLQLLTDTIESAQNFKNFLYDDMSIVGTTMSDMNSRNFSTKFYSDAGSSWTSNYLYQFMNGFVRDKLNIILRHLTWKLQSGLAFQALAGNFMKPRIQEVGVLLAERVSVTIYNGQFDLICSTKGVEAWVNQIKWDGLSTFLSKDRRAFHFGNGYTAGYERSHQNLAFYWILNAGHCVPTDQPDLSLEMVGKIVKPSSS